MSAYNRLNIAITEIPPESSLKVFQFINDVFDENLCKKFFKENFIEYNAGEQYFICYYLKRYINSTKYNTFDEWLNEKQLEYEKNDIIEEYFEFEEEFLDNKNQLLSILDSYENTSQRRLKLFKKHKIPFNQYIPELPQLEKENFKIPLHFNPNVFREFTIEMMSKIISTQQAEMFFYNSFGYGNNLSRTEYLNIEITNRTELTKSISEIKAKYNEEYKFQLIKKSKEYNKLIEKKRFASKLKYRKPTAIDFAKIVYNSFPEIRDTYFAKRLKNPNYSLNQYLTNYTKNFIGM